MGGASSWLSSWRLAPLLASPTKPQHFGAWAAQLELLCVIFIFGHLGALTQSAAVSVMQGEAAGEQACNIAIVAFGGRPAEEEEGAQTMAQMGFSPFSFSLSQAHFFLLGTAAATFSTGRNFRKRKKKAILKLNSSAGADEHKDS